jgi:hypothetical protein
MAPAIAVLGLLLREGQHVVSCSERAGPAEARRGRQDMVDEFPAPVPVCLALAVGQDHLHLG